MSKKKKKSGSLLIIAVVLFLAAGVAAVAANRNVATQAPSSETTQPEAIPAAASNSLESLRDGPPVEVSPEEFAILTTPRILGDPEAPIKISEHSSFTCGACAQYHKTNFKNLKQDYIDTGKAYIVFDDFPRNEIDIVIGSLARCVKSTESYFNFVQMLFETQSDWIGPKYKDHVKQSAILIGLNDMRAEACMNDKKVQEALAANRQKTQDKFNVTSTPTLVINDMKAVPGNLPYDQLKAAIEEVVASQPLIEEDIQPK